MSSASPPNRDPVDPDTLQTLLEDRLGPAEPFEWELREAGHSNVTLFVTWGERDLVVRRPPPGGVAEHEVLHDLDREFRVIRALADSAVPVPEPVFSVEDPADAPEPLYVTERIPGEISPRNRELERFAHREHRRLIAWRTIDHLVSLHRQSPAERGLQDLGVPRGHWKKEGLNHRERTVTRWVKQLEWAGSVTGGERSVEELFEVGAWLDENLPPPGERRITHGDYKLDNLLFEPGTPPRVGGLLDWELAGLDDPRVDLGWLLVRWPDPKDPEILAPELMATYLRHEDYPTRLELVERYEQASGRSFDEQRFFRVLAVFQTAVQCESLFARHLLTRDHEPDSERTRFYEFLRGVVPRIDRWARRILRGDEPL